MGPEQIIALNERLADLRAEWGMTTNELGDADANGEITINMLLTRNRVGAIEAAFLMAEGIGQ